MVTLNAIADSGTFGNPYPRQYSNMVAGNGVIYLLPQPFTAERVHSAAPTFYYSPPSYPVRIKSDYYNNYNENFIDNTRNVLSRSRGPSHRALISSYPGGRNITSRTPIYHRSF